MMVVKIGGSVITDKAEEKVLRHEVLGGIARAVARIPGAVAVVHGAGSYGHPLAKRSGVGTAPHENDRAGAVAEISRDVRELNLHVLNALLKAGCPAISVPPSATVIAEDGRVAGVHIDVLRAWLERGFVPVTFGDVVPDRDIGVGIISGDEMMYHVALAAGAHMAVFLSDVDGVFDRDPSVHGAVLLTSVAPDSHVLFGEVECDVTGALEGKLGWMFRLAGEGVETWMLNGLVPERLVDLATGGTPRGTRILAEGGERG